MRTTGTTYNRSAKAQMAAQAQEKVMPTPTTPTSFNDKLTLRELLKLISPTKSAALPTAKALRESADPIAVYTSKDYSISVYPSGFALAKSYKRRSLS